MEEGEGGGGAGSFHVGWVGLRRKEGVQKQHVYSQPSALSSNITSLGHCDWLTASRCCGIYTSQNVHVRFSHYK